MCQTEEPFFNPCTVEPAFFVTEVYKRVPLNQVVASMATLPVQLGNINFLVPFSQGMVYVWFGSVFGL